MSAKASVKAIVAGNASQALFKWVAILTGSKNALKGAGFFIGAALLEWIGFRGALAVLAGMLALVLVITAVLLPSGVGKMSSKPKFTQVFSRVAAINWLSAARFFLFASRDVWFVVALPVFLYEVLGWSFTAIGSFMAAWVIGYGMVQASAPRLLRSGKADQSASNSPGGSSARRWAMLLMLIPAAIALALDQAQAQGWPAESVLIIGLILFGVVFAINSALHSYLVLAYSDHERVSMNVGFYYMANAGGRLTGTLLSGLGYQWLGLQGTLWISAGFVFLALLLSAHLPENAHDEA